ncbi:NUDIX hydrolase [Bacillus sp. BHET2]|uniref:NUDIX hydrolase n=1 Tax=Bacillus sp. BHET2 TaxID=2583818 RepID=UPI00110D8DCF|nr:NUDIX hydrolase [Bacillus sp. BHET2]TMU86951.1 NUDIX hydrolase [Bacillus sp. BHET2]
MDIVFKNDNEVFNYRVAAVWVENEHILLHRQANDHYWALPGGRVVLGEASKESLMREMREELGVDVQIEQLLMLNENFFPYKEWKYHEIGLYYKVTTEEKTFFQQGEFYGIEGDRLLYKWFSLKELTDVELYPKEVKALLVDRSDAPHHIVSMNKEDM